MEEIKTQFKGFNFPELLVQSLEESEVFFNNQSMTAGYPCQGLAAATHVDEDYSYRTSDQMSNQGRAPNHHHHRRTSSRTSSHYQSVTHQSARHSLYEGTERRLVADMPGYHEQFGAGDDSSDTFSDSSVERMPPSIRTRQQSVVTTTTSISGRSSSPFSSKPHSPSSTSSKPTTNRQGTWFDDEPDLMPGSEEPDMVNDRYVPPRPQTALGFNDKILAKTVPSSPTSPRTLFPNAMPMALPIHLTDNGDRPRTSSGQSCIGKPRIIDIHPPVVPKRKSSLRKLHLQKPAALPAFCQQEGAASDADGSQLGNVQTRGITLLPSPTLPVLSTPGGRTIIDASKRPSLELYMKKKVPHSQTVPTEVGVARQESVRDQHSAGDSVSDLRSKLSVKTSTGHLQGWLRSHTEPAVGRVRASSFVPNSPVAGVPLPADVLNTLRISTSCFPETTLLTSSLSIETIRTYSRKLKHRVRRPTNSIDDEDNESIFTFSNLSTKSRKRWNLPNLMQSRRANKRFASYAHDLTANTFPEPRASKTSGVPEWAPIKNIFPTGTDRLCDALYAHLIAYNYIGTLCPPQPGTSSHIPKETNNAPQRNPSSPTRHSDDNNVRRIPRKAESILGMNDEAAANFSSSGLYSPRDGGFTRPFTRDSEKAGGAPKMSTSSGGGGGSNGAGGCDLAMLRDIHAGLAKCIARLVTTLKLTTGEGMVEGEALSPKETAALDPFLLRTLCELVRCAEEAVC
ncbi:hypothetical protein SMACR_01250 [Sordaria macrospora]|uniref:WGS project CABT00000000 data, contig 2.4 n=2 Tax=Sordaria macrospora TaxID=5147 RepID=F7VQA1_SORMK|nr:uncharacterized protein SMAC_01250 [Sordaria macrospora k-hell]KAA8628609.1 hypothetical protein SMACR_01250 [Sordaria macrospora]WPJ58870.1 hypothetical protein SMAC4_01250 [Sordaria macrospora]CCC07683.1 unnamed protein product [Sordaria macrospora k-hell]